MSQAGPTQVTVIRKRDGRLQPFDTRKVTAFLRSFTWGLDMEFVCVETIVNSLQTRLPADTMTSETFIVFLAEIVSTFSSRHPDYSLLAGRVYTSYHHKRVPKRFSSWVLSFQNASPPVFTDTLFAVVRANADVLDAAVMHVRDYDFTYRAMQTFERSYLIKRDREVNERLQFMFMRVAIGIHGESISDVLETYDLLSARKISFASPALWNGGLAKHHFASCYIYEPLAFDAQCAVANFSTLSTLWSSDGGIGLSVADVPATSGLVTGGHPGLMLLLKVYDSIASFWSRATRHRSSSATAYLPIWHSDVRRFILCRANRASSNYRFRHLFPGLWIPNIFMRRLENNEMWSLFDPAKVTSLSSLYGNAFDVAYTEFERLGAASGTIRARALWEVIADAIRESGTPFIVFADNVNAKNNQMNLGVIKSANLCAEIVQYSSPVETAVCTLASICLPRYIRTDGTFDYAELHRVTKLIVRALDRLIDLAEYPTADAAVSAHRTRPIGIGSQGLADVFAILGIPFTSAAAKILNCRIYETVYHASLECSSELAERFGTYDAWEGSPAQQGVLQVDMWDADTSDRYDFDILRERIRRTGLRNSVLTAQMPTASTAQLFGNSEGIDPYTSNVVQFRILSGNFNEISRPLVSALRKRGLWTESVRTAILAAHGSIQSVPLIPDDVKAVFRTAFELNPRDLIDMAAQRGPFIDQSQSLTLFVASPASTELIELQLHAWRSGLKTGAYYVRSLPASDPQPFGVPRVSTASISPPAMQSPNPTDMQRVSCPCDA